MGFCVTMGKLLHFSKAYSICQKRITVTPISKNDFED